MKYFQYKRQRKSPTWDQFKRQVRKADRDSLLVQCAAASAAIVQADDRDEALARQGLNPWNIADVARTALAWGGFQGPKADQSTLLHLCNMNVQLADEEPLQNPDQDDRIGKILARMYFEQFPGQRSVFPELSRTILLFGSATEYPDGLSPEKMTPGWFEMISNGLTLDDYVSAVFVISVGAYSHSGAFNLEWLDGPAFSHLDEVLSFTAIRQTFSDHLVISAAEFKQINRQFQDPAPEAQKKFAFNPLADRPFIEGVADDPIAPWCQAIIAKALTPAIYHLGIRSLGEGFSRDLGYIFQHYVGRNLDLISGDRTVEPEVRYRLKKDHLDSCDWFLDLPGLLVLIECKARQPIESLRVGGDAWLSSVKDSIGKGINQLNRAHRHIEMISALRPTIDSAKRRIGLVVTLEPFYVDQNWQIREHLVRADLPVGVVSIAELECLATLCADELAEALIQAADNSVDGDMNVTGVIKAAAGRENSLLASTWDSIGIFKRIEAEQNRMAAVAHKEVGGR